MKYFLTIAESTKPPGPTPLTMEGLYNKERRKSRGRNDPRRDKEPGGTSFGISDCELKNERRDCFVACAPRNDIYRGQDALDTAARDGGATKPLDFLPHSS
jgi:hypothetical protein